MSSAPKKSVPQKNGYSAASLKQDTQNAKENDQAMAAARTSSKLMQSQSHRTQDHHDEFMDF